MVGVYLPQMDKSLPCLLNAPSVIALSTQLLRLREAEQDKFTHTQVYMYIYIYMCMIMGLGVHICEAVSWLRI